MIDRFPALIPCPGPGDGGRCPDDTRVVRGYRCNACRSAAKQIQRPEPLPEETQ